MSSGGCSLWSCHSYEAEKYDLRAHDTAPASEFLSQIGWSSPFDELPHHRFKKTFFGRIVCIWSMEWVKSTITVFFSRRDCTSFFPLILFINPGIQNSRKFSRNYVSNEIHIIFTWVSSVSLPKVLEYIFPARLGKCSVIELTTGSWFKSAMCFSKAVKLSRDLG